MFEMSVKSVPGCLVLIVPRLIGVPVAVTPGLGPHDEVPTDADALAVVEALAGAALLLALLLLELLELLELLPHPARIVAPITAANTRPRRALGAALYVLTDLLLLD
ncbi:MAG: hypothetical protein ACLP50_38190 [Solirubrobacteraceae bacterium]